MPLQSLNESQIPDSLLERLVGNTREFPPVCAVLGGILGQVIIPIHLFSELLVFSPFYSFNLDIYFCSGVLHYRK